MGRDEFQKLMENSKATRTDDDNWFDWDGVDRCAICRKAKCPKGIRKWIYCTVCGKRFHPFCAGLKNKEAFKQAADDEDWRCPRGCVRCTMGRGCTRPQEEPCRWIKCTGCSKWFHACCVGLDDAEPYASAVAALAWYCPHCQAEWGW